MLEYIWSIAWNWDELYLALTLLFSYLLARQTVKILLGGTQ